MSLTLINIKKIYDIFAEELKNGEPVEWILDDIAWEWYATLFESQYRTDDELVDYALMSGIDVKIDVFKRGWKWRCG